MVKSGMQNKTTRKSTSRSAGTKIYTRTGDDGTTGLIGGKRVSKNDAAIIALGNLDELNAFLGMIYLPELRKIQADLMEIAAGLAGYKKIKAVASGRTKGKWEKRVKEMEEEIDKMQLKLPELHRFVLPGGCETATQLHLARAVCRRAERAIIGVGGKGPGGSIKYLNRLSDYLFTLARRENFQTGTEEEVWESKSDH